MYGGYSYGKKHLGKGIPMNNRVIKIGEPPSHPSIFVGPVTVRELKKRMEVDNLNKQIRQRNYLSEVNRNESNSASVNLHSQTSENKENISNETVTLIGSLSSNILHTLELDSFSSKNSSSSNHTYTLENSNQFSPSALNSTYDKLEESENLCLKIDETQNITSIHDRKSLSNKSTFRNYRQIRQDSMTSEGLFNVNKSNDVSQFTDASANLTSTNKSVLLSFDNLKLDDECGNLTDMSIKAYQDSPVAQILMDEKFSRDYCSPSKAKSARKSIPANADKYRNSAVTPKVANRKSVSRPVTPKSTPGHKSVSKNNEASVPLTPRPSSTRKTRKSLFSNKEETKSDTQNDSSARKFFSKVDSKAAAATLSTSSTVKRKRCHLSKEELNVLPDTLKPFQLNKENISARETPGKMSVTLITDLKAENCLINSSFRDSTGSSKNRSTPDVFRKICNEMWKSKQIELEKPLTTPFRSKLPQLKKTPKKYDYIQSPISRYIHQGEGIQSMSKPRHSSCVNELALKSKSETKKNELSENKNKPCKIPQLRGNVHRKLDLPKINKSDTAILSSSAISRTSSIHN